MNRERSSEFNKPEQITPHSEPTSETGKNLLEVLNQIKNYLDACDGLLKKPSLDQEELKVFRSLYEKVFELQFETFDFFNPHSELAQSLNQRVSAIEAVLIHKLTESASVKALDNLGVDLLNYLSYSNNSEIAKKANGEQAIHAPA